jgi:acetyl esterase/lipase
MIYRESALLLLLLTFSIASADDRPKRQQRDLPTPTIANFAYGDDSPRQVLDFWQAESDVPTPVVVMIHGGGWVNGDKSKYGYYQVRPFLNAGISVATINYRFIPQAIEQNVKPPVKACIHDAARAVQTIRSRAKEWNIDPNRVAATGSSAGACTSLWLALHDDLADPQSADPVSRESTRLTCAAVVGAQTSLDAKQVREWIPNAVYGGHAFGYAAKGRNREEKFEGMIRDREKLLPLIKEYSPIELVSQDDPAIYLDYPKQKKPPKIGENQPDPTHSAIYGIKLAEKLEAADVEVVLAYPTREDTQYGSLTEFITEKLTTGD